MTTNISLITFDFYPEIGGVQTYLYEISRRMSQHFSISIISPIRGEINSAEKLKRITIENIKALNYYHELRKTNPDFIIIGHAHPQLLLAAILSRKQFCTIAYGNDYLAAQRKKHGKLFNLLLSRSSPLITISTHNAKKLNQLTRASPNIIYPGTDPNFFTPRNQPKSTTDPLTLLSVGRLVPRKGFDVALQSLKRIIEKHPNIKYQIVGDGPDRQRLENIARDLNLDQYVDFLGKVDWEKLPEIYRNADVFLMVSREEKRTASVEGFGIVYLEANASGIPVIAGRSGGAVDAVKDSITGFLVDPNNPAELANRINELIESPDLRHAMGKAGRQWVETEMNWDRAADQFMEVVKARVKP